MNEQQQFTTPDTINTLHEMQEQIQYSFADMLIIDKQHFLRLLEHEITLQEVSRRWFLFVKMVYENAVCPFIRASAELELQRMLELATSIESPELMQLTGRVTITYN
jgi:hypothetical protein